MEAGLGNLLGRCITATTHGDDHVTEKL